MDYNGINTGDIDIFNDNPSNIMAFLVEKKKNYELNKKLGTENWEYNALKVLVEQLQEKMDTNTPIDGHFRRNIYFVVNKLFLE